MYVLLRQSLQVVCQSEQQRREKKKDFFVFVFFSATDNNNLSLFFCLKTITEQTDSFARFQHNNGILMMFAWCAILHFYTHTKKQCNVLDTYLTHCGAATPRRRTSFARAMCVWCVKQKSAKLIDKFTDHTHTNASNSARINLINHAFCGVDLLPR